MLLVPNWSVQATLPSRWYCRTNTSSPPLLVCPGSTPHVVPVTVTGLRLVGTAGFEPTTP